MDAFELENYKKAGRIAAQALDYGRELLKKGASLLDVVMKIEKKILDLGAKPAFPVQVSMNEVAAHYCPEEHEVLSNQLVSLDIGVHVNGYIGDNACSVDLSNNYSDLVKASKEALKSAIEIIRPNIKVKEVGKVIQETIESCGFKPVKNLSGHGLSRYDVHAPPTIPNVCVGEAILKKDSVIAIEPFATTGVGMVHEKGKPTVFSLIGKKSVRLNFVREIQNVILNYNGLPFTPRWLSNFSEAQIKFALNTFKQLGILKEYPPLVEKNNGYVSQAEHTVLVDDEPIILTKI